MSVKIHNIIELQEAERDAIAGFYWIEFRNCSYPRIWWVNRRAEHATIFFLWLIREKLFKLKCLHSYEGLLEGMILSISRIAMLHYVTKIALCNLLHMPPVTLQHVKGMGSMNGAYLIWFFSPLIVYVWWPLGTRLSSGLLVVLRGWQRLSPPYTHSHRCIAESWKKAMC